MAKYKALKEFRLLTNPKKPGVGEVIKKDSIFDITVRRADLVEKNLGNSFIERLPEDE